jgi:hypothetical protein
VHPITVYNFVERAWPWRLRGPGNIQSATNGLLFVGPTDTLNQAVGGTAGNVTGVPMEGLELGYISIHNRSGTTCNFGMGVRIPNSHWVAGQWTQATTTFTDDTADAQSDGGGDFPLESAATTVGNGFVIACEVPFNAISIDVSTANAGTGATRTMFYSNRAGTAWTTMAANQLMSAFPTVLGVTGTTASLEAVIAFDVPENWGPVTVGTNASWTGMPVGMYALAVRATVAPTTAAVANSLSIYRMYFMTETLADNGTFEWVPGAMGAWMEPKGDALVPFFDVANEGNRVTVLVRPRG